MVRTKIDLDVWNNKEDNRAVTLKNIRDELACHGVNRVYLVSSREPDRYDMPALLADAFPGVRDFLDASSFLFTGGESDGWGESWSMPVLWSAIIAGIQGQWRDALEDLLYVVDGTDVHITRESDGQTASIALTEHDDKVWLQETWYIDMASVGKARESTELRWIPTDISNKPRAKPLLDEARDYLESPQLLQALRSVTSAAAERLPFDLGKATNKAEALKDWKM
eukprot:g185.t1